MIVGECPHEACGHVAMREVPDRPLPAYSRETCDGCGGVVWVRYSAVDPMVWTEAGFLEAFDVDAERMTIQSREGHGEKPQLFSFGDREAAAALGLDPDRLIGAMVELEGFGRSVAGMIADSFLVAGEIAHREILAVGKRILTGRLTTTYRHPDYAFMLAAMDGTPAPRHHPVEDWRSGPRRRRLPPRGSHRRP